MRPRPRCLGNVRDRPGTSRSWSPIAGAGVERTGAVGGGPRGRRVGAEGHARLIPGVAGRGQEPPALLGRGPLGRLGEVYRLPGSQVQVQADQAAVPAHPDRTGAELRPSLVIDMRNVVEPE